MLTASTICFHARPISSCNSHPFLALFWLLVGTIHVHSLTKAFPDFPFRHRGNRLRLTLQAVMVRAISSHFALVLSSHAVFVRCLAVRQCSAVCGRAVHVVCALPSPQPRREPNCRRKDGIVTGAPNLSPPGAFGRCSPCFPGLSSTCVRTI